MQKRKTISLLEPSLNGNELKYITECISSGWISSKGEFVNRFEEMFSSYNNGLYSVSSSSGTTALHLALIALGIGKGDEVIVPNLTFAATVNAVIHCGAKPILVDVDSKSWNITVEKIKPLISKNTKAIIPVHLYGQPCDLKRLRILADSHDLYLIEDCAEALGSSVDGEPVGTFGDASMFSFFGNKTITTGEGGMVIFKEKLAANKAKIFRDHGMNPHKKYWHDYIGYNYRLTNLQAALGVAQLEKIEEILQDKKIMGQKYDEAFGFLNVSLQEKLPNTISSYWLYGMVLNNKNERDFLIQYLYKQGIETRTFFSPISEQPAYKFLNIQNEFKNSMELADGGISLPSAASLSLLDQDFVIEHVVSGINSFRGLN
jgi:perosamine synthetase